MVSTVLSAALTGLCVEFVRVEADVSNGLPIFQMVGYLSSEVKEAASRVRSAIHNCELSIPAKKIVVNLSPADVRKRGTAFDLPIAVAVMQALGILKDEQLEETVIVGELGLDGSVKKIPGVLPIVIAAKAKGIKACIVPWENAEEGRLVDGIRIVGISHLRQVCDGFEKASIDRKKGFPKETKEGEKDYSEIRGQKVLKRAAEIAVAGNHNLLMIGPPGVGKTMVAKRMSTIMPPLTRKESMDLTMLYSIAGKLNAKFPLVTKRPYREVHHSITKSAFIGGGIVPKPGEISLADCGILFLDELAEFPRGMLELLRQPMEEQYIDITRQSGAYRFPARFLLVGAMNPCPCGNYPDLNRCNCTTTQIQTYRGKISQPLLDRIDLCVEAERIPYEELEKEEKEETSEVIRERVIKARRIQEERYRGTGIDTNGQVKEGKIIPYCGMGKEEKELLKAAFEKFGFTARTYHKVLCVARTIADLAGEERVRQQHLAEAIGYRLPDRTYWGRRG